MKSIFAWGIGWSMGYSVAAPEPTVSALALFFAAVFVYGFIRADRIESEAAAHSAEGE